MRYEIFCRSFCSGPLHQVLYFCSVLWEVMGTGKKEKGCEVSVTDHSGLIHALFPVMVIAYGKQCRIRDLQRRLSSGSGTRLDHSRAFVWQFYYSEKGQRMLLI